MSEGVRRSYIVNVRSVDVARAVLPSWVAAKSRNGFSEADLEIEGEMETGPKK
jgi:hypothetical protein